MSSPLKFIWTVLCVCFMLISSQAQDPVRFQTQIDELVSLKRPSGNHIIFTGSSSIRMWKNVNEVYPAYSIVNKGFGGSQMSDLSYYLDDLVLKSDPCQVFIYEGDNDLNAGKAVAEILGDTDKVISRIKGHNPAINIVLISPKPSVARWHLKEEYEALNRALAELASRDAQVEFADVWTPALDGNGVVFQDMFLSDNLHMNDKGYDIWKQVIEPFLSDCARNGN